MIFWTVAVTLPASTNPSFVFLKRHNRPQDTDVSCGSGDRDEEPGLQRHVNG